MQCSWQQGVDNVLQWGSTRSRKVSSRVDEQSTFWMHSLILKECHHSLVVTPWGSGGPAPNMSPKWTLGESPIWGSLPTAPPSVGRMWTADSYVPARANCVLPSGVVVMCTLCSEVS